MNNSENFGSLLSAASIADFAMEVITHCFHRHCCRNSQGMAIQATFAEELSGLHDSDHRFLALLGDDENLDLPLLDIENSICGVALRKHDLVLVEFQYGLAVADLGEKEFWIKCVFRRFWHEVVKALCRITAV